MIFIDFGTVMLGELKAQRRLGVTNGCKTENCYDCRYVPTL
jgi:hypothetical protein